nr:MAG TPA: hypothetical protein [Caudoviricetes sp.]
MTPRRADKTDCTAQGVDGWKYDSSLEISSFLLYRKTNKFVAWKK